MASNGVAVHRRGAVAELWLTGRGDVILDDLLSDLVSILAALVEEPQTRVAVLAGDHRAFSRAWDRNGTQAGPNPGNVQRVSTLFQTIAETPIPVLAMVAGDALDAGLALALVCDVRLTAETARFGFPASADGLLPLGGSAARLARIAGRAAALRMLLTGELFSAAEALACGLVSGVYPVDRLTAEAERLADVIASRGPLAVRYAKEAISRGAELPLDQALRFETDLTIILQTTADRAEGVRAFAEKREPEFSGQ